MSEMNSEELNPEDLAKLLANLVAQPLSVNLNLQIGTKKIRIIIESTGPKRNELTLCGEDAIDAADNQWRSSEELARRAGWAYGGRWRGIIADLVRRGFLERDRRTKMLRKARPANQEEDEDS